MQVQAGEIILQDETLLAAFDTDSGAMTRMVNKLTGWVIERRPELGVSFRLLVPYPDHRCNFVLGQKQHAVKVEKVSDNEIRMVWKNLISEKEGALPITFTSNVALNAGSLIFNASLENNSSYTIETIDYPYFGDLTSPSKNTSMTVRTMWYGNLGGDEIYPHFVNEKGYWGDFYPTKTFDSNRSLFCLIQAPDQGLYIEMHDPYQPYLIQYTFEQKPGLISSINRKVINGNEIGGKPVNLEFRTCHFIYVHAGSDKKLVPIVISSYKGDWQAGVDLYKQWRSTWYRQPNIPAWANDLNSWMEIQINSSEEDYNFTYRKLVDYGKQCAANGINAIQLVGWNKGGQDRGNPSLDIDPELGSWLDLYDAIKEVKKMGVKIVLFGKFPWADKTTEWEKNELYKYAAADPYGIPYENTGCSYITPAQLAAINNRRFAVMDFLDPAYRNIAVKEFEKVLALDADGFLYDEVPTHNPVYYNFAAGHGYNPPGFLYNGDIPLAKQLHAAAEKKKQNFLFAGEGPEDWLIQYYPFSYFRINESSTPVCRYIDPKIPLMVAVTGFDDREMLNLCLLNRYIISYEPYNFKGNLDDFPLTLEYGKKIDNLRKKYKEYLWDADFRDTQGVKVISDGNYHYPVFTNQSSDGLWNGAPPSEGSYRYSVFINQNGKRAVVVVNRSERETITVKVFVPGRGSLIMATPEEPEAKPTNGIIQIPARSAVVIIEQ